MAKFLALREVGDHVSAIYIGPFDEIELDSETKKEYKKIKCISCGLSVFEFDFPCVDGIEVRASNPIRNIFAVNVEVVSDNEKMRTYLPEEVKFVQQNKTYTADVKIVCRTTIVVMANNESVAKQKIMDEAHTRFRSTIHDTPEINDMYTV